MDEIARREDDRRTKKEKAAQDKKKMAYEKTLKYIPQNLLRKIVFNGDLSSIPEVS